MQKRSRGWNLWEKCMHVQDCLCLNLGCTFITGQKTEILFACQAKGEEAIEKCHVDKLLDWGRTFDDVQLFMYYNRSMYFNAFYRVLDGEMVYGEYYTETYQKKYRKMPKDVEDQLSNNTNNLATEWSYDPHYLRYQKELENANAWVVNVKKRCLDLVSKSSC